MSLATIMATHTDVNATMDLVKEVAAGGTPHSLRWSRDDQGKYWQTVSSDRRPAAANATMVMQQVARDENQLGEAVLVEAGPERHARGETESDFNSKFREHLGPRAEAVLAKMHNKQLVPWETLSTLVKQAGGFHALSASRNGWTKLYKDLPNYREHTSSTQIRRLAVEFLQPFHQQQEEEEEEEEGCVVVVGGDDTLMMPTEQQAGLEGEEEGEASECPVKERAQNEFQKIVDAVHTFIQNKGGSQRGSDDDQSFGALNALLATIENCKAHTKTAAAIVFLGPQGIGKSLHINTILMLTEKSAAIYPLRGGEESQLEALDWLNEFLAPGDELWAEGGNKDPVEVPKAGVFHEGKLARRDEYREVRPGVVEGNGVHDLIPPHPV